MLVVYFMRYYCSCSSIPNLMRNLHVGPCCCEICKHPLVIIASSMVVAKSLSQNSKDYHSHAFPPQNCSHLVSFNNFQQSKSNLPHFLTNQNSSESWFVDCCFYHQIILSLIIFFSWKHNIQINKVNSIYHNKRRRCFLAVEFVAWAKGYASFTCGDNDVCWHRFICTQSLPWV